MKNIHKYTFLGIVLVCIGMFFFLMKNTHKETFKFTPDFVKNSEGKRLSKPVADRTCDDFMKKINSKENCQNEKIAGVHYCTYYQKNKDFNDQATCKVYGLPPTYEWRVDKNDGVAYLYKNAA